MQYQLDVEAVIAGLESVKKDLQSGDTKDAQQRLRNMLWAVAQYNYQAELDIVYDLVPPASRLKEFPCRCIHCQPELTGD